MNVDILDSDGVVVTTGAFDDGFWNTYGQSLQARIAPTGMSLSTPGSNSPQQRVNNVGGFDALVQSASMSGERRGRFGYERMHRPHPAFGLGDAIPASASANAVSNAKEVLAELAPMGVGGVSLFLVAKSLGASLLGATTAGIGGVVLASWVAMRGGQS